MLMKTQNTSYKKDKEYTEVVQIDIMGTSFNN